MSQQWKIDGGTLYTRGWVSGNLPDWTECLCPKSYGAKSIVCGASCPHAEIRNVDGTNYIYLHCGIDWNPNAKTLTVERYQLQSLN